MQKLTKFSFKDLFKKRIYNKDGEFIGILLDFYISDEGKKSRVIGYKIKKDMHIFNCEFKDLEVHKDGNDIYILGIEQREMILINYSYLLKDRFFNKVIIKPQTGEGIRIRNLKLEKYCGEIVISTLIYNKRENNNSILKNILKKFNTFEIEFDRINQFSV